MGGSVHRHGVAHHAGVSGHVAVELFDGFLVPEEQIPYFVAFFSFGRDGSGPAHHSIDLGGSNVALRPGFAFPSGS